MRVLVTGGTGFIGQSLCPRLAGAGHEVIVLTRQTRPALPSGVSAAVNLLESLDDQGVDAVINLAGAPIADARWSESRKKLLVDSRVETTARLVSWMGKTRHRPTVLVSGSAVGYYGEQGDTPVTEETQPVPGFTNDLCEAWEAAALKARDLGVRVAIARTGVVLDRDGGALAKMLPAFKLGLGGPLGSGEHYFPWIHREDMVSVLVWLLDNPQASGPYNASAPEPVTNARFTRALGAALRRPTVFKVPAPALKLLLGEMSEVLLGSDRMLPARLLREGFEFRHPRIEEALAAIFS